VSEKTLASKLREIRALKSKGSDFEVQTMYEILALEKASVLWRVDGTETFTSVLKQEAGICTPTRFKAFKKAVACFSQATIERLGVPCVCLLAVQNQSVRAKLLKAALAFRTEKGTEPTYQYISRFLAKPKNDLPSRARLLKYVDVLRAEIKSLGGRVPMME
jgi:hypothetical protein